MFIELFCRAVQQDKAAVKAVRADDLPGESPPPLPPYLWAAANPTESPLPHRAHL